MLMSEMSLSRFMKKLLCQHPIQCKFFGVNNFKPRFPEVRLVLNGCPPGDLLYPLARTGPVVPAHPGDDQERGQAEREFP
jgi:hypothetical protein